MKPFARNVSIAALVLCGTVGARQEAEAPAKTFEQVAVELQAKVEASVQELAGLRKEIADEKIPLTRELSDLERELRKVRQEYQDTSRLLDTRTLDLSKLRQRIREHADVKAYLSTLFIDYLRNFETRLHVSEFQRYEALIDAARTAADSAEESATFDEVFAPHVALLSSSIDRLGDALGGTRFEGQAIVESGQLKRGTFLLVGPSALFASKDGVDVGSVQQRVNSSEPAVLPLADPETASLAVGVVANGTGTLPLDPTLGDAFKVAATEETFLEHVQKGGPVMVPIFAMAGLALLVALFKWASMAFLRAPSQKRIRALLDAVSKRDEDEVQRRVTHIRGPVGKMLASGVEHIREPRELVEEVMYEVLLKTRLKLQRMLPFIAICAASAPLLGLLGTVTGIIYTFKLITIFGSGDVKTLSHGISEALITTKFGLIVAIPSLLLHAFLSRKARGIVGQMEMAAVAFANQVSKTPFVAPARAAAGVAPAGSGPVPDPEIVRGQVNDILGDILGPIVRSAPDGHPTGKLVGTSGTGSAE